MSDKENTDISHRSFNFSRKGAYLLPGGALFCFFLLLYVGSCSLMKRQTHSGSREIEKSTVVISNFVGSIDTTYMTNLQFNALKTQDSIIVLKKKHYMHVAKDFYAHYFASTLVMMFSAICGAIVIFLVAYDGWSKTTDLARTMFVVFFFCATFFGLFPSVFMQEKNYTENFNRYVELDKLHQEIFNFLSTGCKLDINSVEADTDTMLTLFNKRILEHSNFVIGIDLSGVRTMDEFAKKLQGGGVPGK